MEVKDLGTTDKSLLIWMHQLEVATSSIQGTLSYMLTHGEIFKTITGKSEDLIEIRNKLQELDTLISTLVTNFANSRDLQDGWKEQWKDEWGDEWGEEIDDDL